MEKQRGLGYAAALVGGTILIEPVFHSSWLISNIPLWLAFIQSTWLVALIIIA
jgi:hypothetical protein